MATAVITATAVSVLIENLPNAIEAALKIRQMLADQGIASKVQTTNQQTIESASDVEQIIETWNKEHPR